MILPSSNDPSENRIVALVVLVITQAPMDVRILSKERNETDVLQKQNGLRHCMCPAKARVSKGHPKITT